MDKKGRHIAKDENYGGWSEIRTHGGRKSSTVFKTVAFNRSAIHPHKLCAHYTDILL